jgi:hypothetical protein
LSFHACISRTLSDNPGVEGWTVARSYRVLLALLIVAGWFFGLAPFLAPKQFADATGFLGTDTFTYRIAGAATFAYGVGLLLGWRASWAEMRIPFIATFVFNLCSIFACIAAILGGNAQWIVFVILLASILFTAGTGYFIYRPLAGAPPGGGPPNLAQWVMGLFAVGTVAALFFGVATLVLAGAFGKAVGASGADDFIYRQAGSATMGAGIGGVFVLMARRWESARLPAVMSLVFNGLSVVAAILQIGTGTGGTVIAWVILAAASLVTVGSMLAIHRRGQ